MKSPQCPRLARHITILRAYYRHLDKAEIRRLITDHTTLGCPACTGYTTPRYLPRDPHQTIQEN